MNAQTESGTSFEPVYHPHDLLGFQPLTQLGEPGQFPFTRGIHPHMYAERLWTIRQDVGAGSIATLNRRILDLVADGYRDLTISFDLPTQMGYDSDSALAVGEIGHVGAPIDSIADMRALFEGVNLAEVSVAMTINAPAAVLLALYELVAEEQGVPSAQLRGTIQNDVLKEYITRGTYLFPPQPSMRLVGDILRYCSENMPLFNPISVSGYHMAESGANPAQEVAFTLANAIAYVEAGIAAGLSVDEFAPRMSFFFSTHTHLLEEVAKFRAARRMWAHIMKDSFHASLPASCQMRFHAQTSGIQLIDNQPSNNIVRATIQMLAAVLGGTQSMRGHNFDVGGAADGPDQTSRRCDGHDIAGPQHIIAHETDLAKTVDPFAGSYVVETLTEEIEKAAEALMCDIADQGGAVRAIENGYQKYAIETQSYQWSQSVDSGERVVVGVNRFVPAHPQPKSSATSGSGGVDRDSVAVDQLGRLAAFKASRDMTSVYDALGEVTRVALEDVSIVERIKGALKCGATIGEVCEALRREWKMYRPSERF